MRKKIVKMEQVREYNNEEQVKKIIAMEQVRNKDWTCKDTKG